MNTDDIKSATNGRTIAGIILIGAGAVLLLRTMGYLFPGWLFTWPVIIILFGIYSALRHRFRRGPGIILIVLGSFFLVNNLMPDLNLQLYFWPVFIILAGLSFIFKKPCNRSRHRRFGQMESTATTAPETGSSTFTDKNTGSTTETDYLCINSIFSGVSRTVLSKNFQGAQISCIFGGAEINFSKADIAGPVVIKSEVVFGGVKLFLPPNWTVQNEIEGIFHGIDDKRRFSVAPETQHPTKTIILKGSVVFGGIDIRNAYF